MMKRLLAIIPMMFCIVSCLSELSSESDVFVDFEVIDSPTTPLNTTARTTMNGVYKVVEPKDVLGDLVVGKWIGRRWCLFSQHDVVFSETAGGSSGDSIKLSGYIRTVRSGSGTRIRLKLLYNDGAKEIISGDVPSSIRIKGTTEDGNKIELKRLRNSYSPSFTILAHRGGGRNSDRLGMSENSIPMIEHASIFGATGVEIDVTRTRDNKLIVFHDDTFSPRTVQGNYLLGSVENFDLDQIKLFGRLINGEQIPTLSEALNSVIESTELSFVWLDIKDPNTVDQVIQIQKEATNHAAAISRDVKILLGIPSDEVLKAYNNSPSKYSTDILIELAAETALSFPNCRVWAPRWTNNITDQEITKMHNAGKLVFTWTVDVRESIVDYLDRVDGILSNYPSLVRGIHDSKY